MRETSPYFRNSKSYPRRWWRKLPPHFFPRWNPIWNTLKPWDYDPWFDNLPDAHIFELNVLNGFTDEVDHHRDGRSLLFHAVIEQALHDLIAVTGAKPLALERFRWRAWYWLMDKENDRPYSFNWYCYYINVNPNAIRLFVKPYKPKGEQQDTVRRKGRPPKAKEPMLQQLPVPQKTSTHLNTYSSFTESLAGYVERGWLPGLRSSDEDVSFGLRQSQMTAKQKTTHIKKHGHFAFSTLPY